MANLQYIGARYVPKFYENPDTGDMTWKGNVGYEALTVVKFNDDTYTSKKPVPPSVGNPAANPTFWAKTADYNAAMAALQTEISNIHNEVDNLSLKPLSGLIVIADSYGGTSEWHTKLINRLSPDVSYHSYQSGAAFHDGTFLSQLSTIVSGLSTEQKRLITDVIIGGGYNDRESYPNSEWITTVKSGIEACRDYVNANLPNASLHVACVGYCYNNEENFNKVMFANYIYEESCATLGIHCLKLPKYGCVSLVSAQNMSNDSHPNSSGGSHIATLAAMELLGDTIGQSTPIFPNAVAFTFLNSQTPTPASLNMNFWQSNTKLLINCTESSFHDFTIDLSAQRNREVIIATATLPRDIHFNHVYRIHVKGLAIYNTEGRVVTSYIVEFTQNTINLYIQNEFADILNRINVGPFNIEIDNYTK